MSVLYRVKPHATKVIGLPVPVSWFPDGKRFVEVRKAWKQEVCGIHVKPHDIDLGAKQSTLRCAE